MARARKKLFAILALSPSATATALSIPLRRVREAMATGELEAFQDGPRVRILCESTIAWVKTWPRAKRKRT